MIRFRISILLLLFTVAGITFVSCSTLPSLGNHILPRQLDIPIVPDYYWISGHDWIPSALVANSTRSPCPMLNTLANHGFLPRDGKSITKDMLNTAQVDVLNMSPELASHTTNAMVKKLGSPKNTSNSFDLDDFAAHDATEHDASLTRQNLIQGSTIDVDPGLVHLMLADSPQDWVNTESIGRSRVRRESESWKIGSPPLSSAFTSFAQLEASFIVLVFGIGGDKNVIDDRVAPKEQVKDFFDEERFPVDKGYYRSSVVLNGELQNSIISGIRDWYEELLGKGNVTA